MFTNNGAGKAYPSETYDITSGFSLFYPFVLLTYIFLTLCYFAS
jgi:hypothetical protein